MTSNLKAQAQSATPKKDVSVQKHTLMERFEPDLMVPLEERIALKKQRIADAQRTRALLDTLDISERKRQKLLNDLKESPFSNRLSKTIADSKFEDAEND
ncbi:hypothetical protein SAMN04488514_101126 [Kriegella aquimaris]|uniref:Uncharacterized protein n=2 Tax=Kriegella aquimaris TaxID=192904 RepID=A0A1G9IGK0_9FLAO|nr:hypothetical protein SAMN04488514_101126 [Kriegella aquimaris]